MSHSSSSVSFWLYPLIAAGFVVACLFGFAFGYRYPIWTLRAFRVPSSSMCPTVCNGERIFAELRGNQPYVPQRGGVILFEYGAESSLFIKRVIGIPGDTVGPGPDNTILVNGKTWQAPAVCAKSLLEGKAQIEASPTLFPVTHVAANQVFVIGDNLNYSLDSRTPHYEPITFDKILGKPVLIYWSPESARIGCPVQ